MKWLTDLSCGEWGYLSAALGLFGMIGLGAENAPNWPMLLIAGGCLAAMAGAVRAFRENGERRRLSP